MEFINRMKKREFIEMGLKTLAAVLAAFLAIILMEGMIYSIELHAVINNNNGFSKHSETVVYCIEKSDDKYQVIYYNDNVEDKEDQWRAVKQLYTKEQCEALKAEVAELHYNAPNSFELSITPVHYVIMAIFVAGVVAFFVYKFVALSKEYKKIEDTYKKTGTVEIGNY